MNIAFVTIGFAPLRTAGIDIIGERLIRGILAENHHVTVIAGQREDLPEVFDDPRLEIVRLPLGPTNWIGFGLRAAIVLRALTRIKNFDIIHFSDIYFDLSPNKEYRIEIQTNEKNNISEIKHK